MKKNVIKKCFFFTFIIIIICIVCSIILKYDVEGEKKLPFEITKILEVSTVTGDIEESEAIWNIKPHQINDIYIYYNKSNSEEFSNIAIDEITYDNFKINSYPTVGNIILLKPTGDIDNLYNNSFEDFFNVGLSYSGSLNQNLKNMEINNSNGMTAFRISLENIGNFISNDQEEVVYDGTLLTKIGLNNDSLKFNISFDINVKTTDNVTYVGNMNLDLPIEGLIENGSVNNEIKDFSNLIFKRENK